MLLQTKTSQVLLHTTHRCLCTAMLLRRNAFTHTYFYAGVLLTQSSPYTNEAFTQIRLQRCFYIIGIHLYRGVFCTQILIQPVHRDAFTHRCLYTLIRLLTAFTYDIQVLLCRYSLHANTFTQRYFDTQWQVLLHAGDVFFTHYIVFHTRMLFHRDVTEMLLHRVAFTHRNAFTHTHTVSFAQRWFYTEQLYAQMPEQTEFFFKKKF